MVAAVTSVFSMAYVIVADRNYEVTHHIVYYATYHSDSIKVTVIVHYVDSYTAQSGSWIALLHLQVFNLLWCLHSLFGRSSGQLYRNTSRHTFLYIYVECKDVI